MMENWLGTEAASAMEKEAQTRLFAIEEACKVYQSPACQKSREDLSEQYNLLKECLQADEQQKMLLELDTLYHYWAADHGESLFVQGFYEGITFLRNALEIGLNKKERTAGTVRSFR